MSLSLNLSTNSALKSRLLFRRDLFPIFFKAAMLSALRRPVLARLLPTRCPSCIDSEATSKARRLVASCLAPLASSLLRSRISLPLTVNIARQSAASSTAVSATANRSTRLKKVRMSSLRRRVVYSTICSRRILTSNQSKSSCLTRSTGCSTWASLTTFSALSKCATRTGRPFFSLPQFRRILSA